MPRTTRTIAIAFVAGLFGALVLGVLSPATPAGAQVGPPDPTSPATRPPSASSDDAPLGTIDGADGGAPGSNTVTFNLDSGGPKGGVSTSQPLTIVLLLTVIALAPAMLILLTSFTRIIIVLGLTRNALNLQGVPPNQVLIGLSLFLTLFVMGPVFSEVNQEALQPFMNKEISQSEAFERGLDPFRGFMFKNTRDSDLSLFSKLAGDDDPKNEADVPTATLIPAFVISELRAAFLIGFIIFVPFLVIDMVTSAALMSMGMVMLPPVLISLPFKLLLFVIVDGWAVLVQSLVKSFA